ncbi:DUF559 domain-containing protein [uncultured Tessaracoccus sp.]|uniref:DUF559 domain-containing protein n=1 Tax=uncultured Tessaracoccus sp. TaxID=905023 RepID=UPI002613D375|nr:DUF559 domain-containing protein [uncultured Tessaracoccus sp.]
MHAELRRLIAEDGAIARSQHPELHNPIRHAVQAGQLVPLLPGTYSVECSFTTLVAAVRLWDPDAVFTGATAAKLSWWDELPTDTVQAISRRRTTREVPGLRLTRGTVEPSVVFEHGGLRLVHPAWSALELTDELGGEAIDEALRRRATSLPAMRWALGQMSDRPGNTERRRLLLESRDEPWSELERDGHRRLRRARLTGWKGNYRIVLPNGSVRYGDIVYEEPQLVVELDSWTHHSSREAFVDDRRKDVELTLQGWTVLRFTKDTMDDLVPSVRAALQMLNAGPPR